MEIVRETIIIPDEKEINIEIYSKKLTTKEAHGLGIKEFSDKYNLGLTHKKLGLKESDYHDISWYIETAKLGHLVIQKDENIILYIPPILTKNQYRFLLDNKSNIEEYGFNIHAVSLFFEDGKFYRDNLDEVIHEYENKQIDILFKAIRKKYIPSNNSYVLIIPNEEELKIENEKYFQEFDSNLLEGHGKIYQVFCLRNQIFVNVPNDGGYFWGKELLNKNIMSVIKEDNEIYIFIPNKLSNNQYNWFLNKNDYLSGFEQLEAGVYQNGLYKEIYKYGENYEKTQSELVNEIYQIVESKKPVSGVNKRWYNV